MIKRTLYFGNPAYLSTNLDQVVIKLPDTDEKKTIPIEDTGIVILDNQQISISQALIAKLLENNVALITCDASHHPSGLMLNLDGHTLQSQKFKDQLSASKPLLKQLWQQTIVTKIENQANLLSLQNIEVDNMKRWMLDVKSGDTSNREARAAVFYWSKLFKQLPDFTRNRYGEAPNNLLNYGYAILRAIVARSLVGSGLLPTLGIFHKNQYNAYCLADDIMEPYRPFVDQLVLKIIDNNEYVEELNPSLKKELLQIPTLDVEIDGQTSPLMIAVQRTTTSLAKCYAGEIRKILYPTLKT
jgi:CRISPR-associated protein Cas1